jgi:hypothetical protein
MGRVPLITVPAMEQLDIKMTDRPNKPADTRGKEIAVPKSLVRIDRLDNIM